MGVGGAVASAIRFPPHCAFHRRAAQEESWPVAAFSEQGIEREAALDTGTNMNVPANS